jgi:hypothetical protein
MENKNTTQLYWEHFRETSLEELTDPFHRIQNTMLSCVLLQIKKHDNKLSKVPLFYSKGKGQSTSFASPILYDRIFLFGVLESTFGNCIMLVSTSSEYSLYLLDKLGHDTPYIGKTVALIEPNFEGKSLGKEGFLPIVSTQKQLEPLVLTQRYEVPLNNNLQRGETSFFSLYGMLIELDGAVIIGSDCHGIGCDRLLSATQQEIVAAFIKN